MLPLLALSTAISLAAPAMSDAQAFREYESEQFYLYSQMEKNSFSCRIQLNQVDALVAGLKAKAASGKLPMDIKDSLSTFALKYTRATDTLEFTRPTLALAIKTGTTVPHPERLEQGMTQIFSGFNQQVEGAIGIIQGLLHEFLISRHDAISDVQFERTATGYRASFSMDGGATTTQFDGTTKHSEIRIGSGTLTAKATFEAGASEKLILRSAEMVPAPGQRMSMVLQTQEIDGMVLPTTIEMSAIEIARGIPSNSGMRIVFTHCRVE
jgi:hypothetical protein